MILKMFSVFDIKASAYSAPFFKPAAGVAVRDFQSAVSDPNSLLSKYPADFRLDELGSWDDSDGSFLVHSKPIVLGFGSDYAEVKSNGTLKAV